MIKVVKKCILSGIIITSILATIFSLFTFLDKKLNHEVILSLKGNENLELEVNSSYSELGANLLIDGIDKSNEVIIDNKNLLLNKLGEYQIKYSYQIGKQEYKTYRKIIIIDTEKPNITLNGNEFITILKGTTYEELGAKATDNYDGDITNKIKIEGNIDTNSVGEYKLTYTVSDSSNNTSSIERKIIIKEPFIPVAENQNENKEVVRIVVPTIEIPNSITSNKFTTNGFYLEGYQNNSNDNFKLIISSDIDYEYEIESIGNNKYRANIDISNLPNGNYNIYIESNEIKERLVNKMSYITKINRAKVGNRLLTFSYTNDEVSISIDDFYYQYDILIDPGHGGDDTGAINQYIYEKDMNLIVSNYEKCRYEQHGLSVYMTRTTDTYGNGLGSDYSLSRLHRRAYEVGYYGTVSKVVYSNHHNYVYNPNVSGYEILLPGYLTSNEIIPELNIVSRFNSIYPLTESHKRFYAKDYDTEVTYSKLNGETYTFKDNYAINRIPYQVFNTKAIIYEGSYISNLEEFNWYWNSSNWIKISEIKIEEYLKYLGVNYNSDNSSCL